MKNPKTEVLFEGIEVPVPVQESVVLVDAEGRDETVDGLPNGDSPRP